MEVIRQKVGTPDETCASRQLTARQLLKGELEGKDLEEYVESRVLLDHAREGAELGAAATRSSRSASAWPAARSR